MQWTIQRAGFLLALFVGFERPLLAGTSNVAFEDLGGSYPVELSVACDGACSLPELLDSGYARLALGQFDLRFPAPFLADKQHVERFAEVCEEIVALELEWLDWHAASGEDAKRVRKLAKEVTKWIRGWKPAELARWAESDREVLDLLEVIGGKAKRVAAVTEFGELLTSGRAHALALGERERCQLVFAPDRQNLVALASFVGLQDEYNREAYWHDGILSWTDFWWNDVNVVALEYPPVDPRPDTFRQGIDMNGREKTGLVEHVLQRAAYSLCWRAFGRDLEPAFESGLAQNLVIGVVGQNNTRSGGSTKGSIKAAQQRFVPGGQSHGGRLPKNNADSVWRSDLGKDFFAQVLSNSQKSGRPKRGDKLASFVLTSSGAGQTVVKAPFLGAAAHGKALPPEAFLSDYREFFRAYKSAFAHWLRTEGGRTKKDSEEKFAVLLGRMGDAHSGDSFGPMVEEIYGLPLSAGSDQEDSLEWRFLRWVSKQ